MPPFSEAPFETRLLLVLGALFLLGLGADLLGRFTFLPRVTLLILCGLALGPSGLGVLPTELVHDGFPLLTDIALGMVGFLLGGKLTLSALRRRGRVILGISIGEVLGAALCVALALLLAGATPAVALLLAGIAPASDPVVTYDVVHERGASGTFPDTLLGVVGIDDAWGLLTFTLLMAVSGALLGAGGWGHGLLAGLGEVGGSLAIGVGLGLPMAHFTGRVQPGEPLLAEALGLVLTCCGIALWLDVSPILATMALGSTVATRAKHHRRPFHAIEGIEWPFLILFFVLAGASLELASLARVGWIGAAYLLGRTAGLYAGARLGARAAGASEPLRRWLGLALLPQAGVALGMALLASQRFPDLADVLLPVALASTVVFELVAPVITRRVLRRAGAAP